MAAGQRGQMQRTLTRNLQPTATSVTLPRPSIWSAVPAEQLIAKSRGGGRVYPNPTLSGGVKLLFVLVTMRFVLIVYEEECSCS